MLSSLLSGAYIISLFLLSIHQQPPAVSCLWHVQVPVCVSCFTYVDPDITVVKSIRLSFANVLLFFFINDHISSTSASLIPMSLIRKSITSRQWSALSDSKPPIVSLWCPVMRICSIKSGGYLWFFNCYKWFTI